MTIQESHGMQSTPNPTKSDQVRVMFAAVDTICEIAGNFSSVRCESFYRFCQQQAEFYLAFKPDV